MNTCLENALGMATTEEFFERLFDSPGEALLDLRIPEGADRWDRRFNWAAMVPLHEAGEYRDWLPGAREFGAWVICRADDLSTGKSDLCTWLERAEETSVVSTEKLWNAYYPGGACCAEYRYRAAAL